MVGCHSPASWQFGALFPYERNLCHRLINKFNINKINILYYFFDVFIQVLHKSGDGFPSWVKRGGNKLPPAVGIVKRLAPQHWRGEG